MTATSSRRAGSGAAGPKLIRPQLLHRTRDALAGDDVRVPQRRQSCSLSSATRSLDVMSSAAAQTAGGRQARRDQSTATRSVGTP